MLPLTIDPMPIPNQVINLVSNLPPITTSVAGGQISFNAWGSSSFTTGINPFVIASVTLRFAQITAATPPNNLFVRLYSNSSGEPGSEITSFTFTNPGSITTTTANNIFTLSTPQILPANTTFWLVVGSGSGQYVWALTDSVNETKEPGWLIGNNSARFSPNGGGSWTPYPNNSFQFSINGQSYSLYPSNILLFLSGNGFNNSTNILDSSSYSRTLTRYGNTVINTAESRLGNGCIDLDGNGDYLEFNYTPDFSLTGEFRVETWFKAKVLSGFQTIISKDTNGVNFDFGLFIVNNNSLAVYTNRGFENLTVPVPSMNTNTWYKIVFERKLISGILTNTIYLNNIAYGSNTMQITNDSQVRLSIGAAGWNNPNTFFNGFIEDLIITSPL